MNSSFVFIIFVCYLNNGLTDDDKFFVLDTGFSAVCAIELHAEQIKLPLAPVSIPPVFVFRGHLRFAPHKPGRFADPNHS